jgi:hypothetical protein
MWWTQSVVVALMLCFSNHPNAASIGADPTLSPSATLSTRNPAPSNCKKLSIDSDWPFDDVWKFELPGVEAREPNQMLKHPDWTYEVKTVEQVQQAVRFAAKHNVRLSIFNTGHDFMNRFVCPMLRGVCRFSEGLWE